LPLSSSGLLGNEELSPNETVFYKVVWRPNSLKNVFSNFAVCFVSTKFGPLMIFLTGNTFREAGWAEAGDKAALF